MAEDRPRWVGHSQTHLDPGTRHGAGACLGAICSLPESLSPPCRPPTPHYGLNTQCWGRLYLLQTFCPEGLSVSFFASECPHSVWHTVGAL